MFELRDVRMAIRRLRLAPGFTLVALLTLALGIAATSAIFTVVEAVILRPLPYPHADRLVRIGSNLQRINLQDAGPLGVGAVRLPRSLRALRRRGGDLDDHGEPDRRVRAAARRNRAREPDLLSAARRAAADRPSLRPAGLHARHLARRRDQRRPLATRVRRRPRRARQDAAHRQRPVHDHRRHRAGIPSSERDTRNRDRGVGAVRMDRVAAAAADALRAIPSRRDRPAEARHRPR